MKVSKTILTLIVALAAGSAAAASAGTTAGTGINNVATASFDDPSTGTAAPAVNSNTVTTTVLPVIGFDIVYTDGSADGNTASTPATSADKTNILPGGTVNTPYSVVNNSNIDNYVVNLTADTTGSSTALPNVAPTAGAGGVQYFLADAAGNPTGPAITQVTLSNGGTIKIVQVLTVPSAATKAQQYSASPHGVAPAGGTGSGAYLAYDENTNGNNGDLEFSRATIYSPVLTPPLGPSTPVPTSPIVIPPTNPGTDPNNPNNPVSPPTTPTDPTDPSGTGYPDSAHPTTSIAVIGNDQNAYPLANQTSVTFSNNVHNGGALSDTVKLFPTDATGNPIGTNNGDGSFTVPAIGGNPGYKVTFTKLDNTALATATGSDGKVYPVLTVAAGGDSGYHVKIDYANPQTLPDPVAIAVTVGVSSGNKASTDPVNADTKSKDTIYPPGMFFGDDVSGVPTPAQVGPGNAAQTVDPSKSAAGAPVTAAGVNTDATAVFPMVITNPGEYNDSFTLTKTTIIMISTRGSTVSVPVRYVYADGSAVTQDTAGNYITKVVAANGSLKVYAVVDVPVNIAATTGTTGSNPEPSFTQTATGNYSGVQVIDNNDRIKVQYTGAISVAKTQSVRGSAFSAAAATARPGDALAYQIVATNNYNASVFNFKLKDNNATGGNAFTYTDFVSVNVILNGFTGQTPALASSNVYYSVDGGNTFTTTVPTPATVGTNGLQVAIDTDNSGTITAADQVPAGASITLTINTTVK
ncbi:hypothetical protein DKM44_03305 [Deinococcus irradiatisoli]|uniref:DUF11 domain-containing protein n=1 Tax=Deinococcus irradiatisoli TaxID=2202254 RepID=A0A2Z3JFX7_9DEIO|nr:hypothetical protein [Deinococcus irradiatisoli]AWN22381.1 hypothetical protein DKM44_03305 [Deinococcus irradiatisoli]